jgi:hypothetical protein
VWFVRSLHDKESPGLAEIGERWPRAKEAVRFSRNISRSIELNRRIDPQAPTRVYLTQVLEASALVMRSGLLLYARCLSSVIEQSRAASQPGAVTIL